VLSGLPTLIAIQAAQRSQEKPEDEQTWFERLIGDALSDGLDEWNSNTTAAAATATAGADVSQLIQMLEGQGDTPDRGRDRNTPKKIEHSPTYNIEGLSELERQLRQDKRELQNEIDQIKRSISQT